MTPEDFVEVFITGWSQPKPEGFLDYFGPLSHPDIVATQPLLPTATGREAYLRSFRNTFALLQDMTAEVRGSVTGKDTIHIESVVTARIGRRPVKFEVCDRFELRDGLIYRRQAFFDPTPIVIGVLLRPWVLPKVFRALRG